MKFYPNSSSDTIRLTLNDSVAIKFAGKDKWFINPNCLFGAGYIDNKLGIGISAPTHKLHALSTDNKAFLLDRNTGNNPTSLNEFSSYYSLSIKNRASGTYLNFGGDSTHTSLQPQTELVLIEEYSFKSLWWQYWYCTAGVAPTEKLCCWKYICYRCNIRFINLNWFVW